MCRPTTLEPFAVRALDRRRPFGSGLTTTWFDRRYLRRPGLSGNRPLFMQRVRPAWLPPLPGISWFLELNVRTYVYDQCGRPGVWFYSLNCNQPLAVALARRFFHLPYFHARMTATRCAETMRFTSERRGSQPPPSSYAWRPGAAFSTATPGSLEFFLAERYLLFAADSHGRLFSGRVHHAPYEINTPVVSECSTVPARQAGFELTGEPVSLLAARPVDVSIFPLRPVAAPSV
jgi:uncharacterized protein YqjF (DUF2071 family)